MKTAPGSREPIDILSILKAVVCVLAILSMGLGVVENRRLSNLVAKFRQDLLMESEKPKSIDQIASLRKRVSELQAANQKLDAALNTTKQRFDSMTKNLTDDLAQVRTNITALDTNLSNQVRVKVEALNESLADIRVKTYQNISSVSESLAAVIVEAYQNISSVAESLAAVRVEAYQNISSLNESLAAVRVEAYQNISSVDESLADVKAEANQNISSVNQRLAKNITELNGKLDMQVSDIRQNTAELGTELRQGIANNSIDVGNLSESLTEDIDGLDFRLRDKEYSYIEKNTSRNRIRLVMYSVNWDNAKIYCEAAGEHLLTFDSTDEADWFQTLQNTTGYWNRTVWLGLRGTVNGYQYQWKGLNNSDVPEYLWIDYWPKRLEGKSYCVLAGADGEWVSDLCSDRTHHFVCEKSRLTYV